MGFFKRYYENEVRAAALQAKTEAQEELILVLREQNTLLKERNAFLEKKDKMQQQVIDDLKKAMAPTEKGSYQPTQAQIMNEWFNGKEGADG